MSTVSAGAWALSTPFTAPSTFGESPGGGDSPVTPTDHDDVHRVRPLLRSPEVGAGGTGWPGDRGSAGRVVPGTAARAATEPNVSQKNSDVWRREETLRRYLWRLSPSRAEMAVSRQRVRRRLRSSPAAESDVGVRLRDRSRRHYRRWTVGCAWRETGATLPQGGRDRARDGEPWRVAGTFRLPEGSTSSFPCLGPRVGEARGCVPSAGTRVDAASHRRAGDRSHGRGRRTPTGTVEFRARAA